MSEESNAENDATLPAKTWPENAYPTGRQYATWLALLTPEQQAMHLDGVIAQAERGAFCSVFHHTPIPAGGPA